MSSAHTETAYIMLPLTCGCPGGRRLPLRVMPEAVFWLRANLQAGAMPPHMVVQTYRCRDCGQVVEITAAALSLGHTCAPGSSAPQ